LGKFSLSPYVPQAPAQAVGEHNGKGFESKRLPVRPEPVEGRAGTSIPKHPLSGLTVMEFATFIASPWVTGLLSDLGARVIKIEPITGDLYRAMAFPKMCKTIQGKEALSLDLKDPRAQEAVQKLIAKSDVLLHNFRPGVPERLGIGWETARKIRPDIVYVYAGAYGSTGPHSHRTGFHPIAGAITGAPWQQAKTVIPPSDQPLTLDELQYYGHITRKSNETNPDPCAAMACASATMLAIYYRALTGKGQYVETSMLGGNLYANADDALSYAGKPERPSVDKDFNGLNALYRQYQTKQWWVFFACPSQSEWEAFGKATGRTDLLNDARFNTVEARRANDAALAAALEPLFATRTAREWEALLAKADVACVEVLDGDNGKFLVTQPWTKDAGIYTPTEHPSLGKYWRANAPWAFSLTPGQAGPNCYLGEHTRPILRELGYDNATVDQWVAEGIAVSHEAQPVAG
ncbi:MAG: CoA transferase, partial [Chloroflexi bacterium]|nr:CoA transferase [Chloroflexota bacterium]